MFYKTFRVLSISYDEDSPDDHSSDDTSTDNENENTDGLCADFSGSLSEDLRDRLPRDLCDPALLPALLTTLSPEDHALTDFDSLSSELPKESVGCVLTLQPSSGAEGRASNAISSICLAM